MGYESTVLVLSCFVYFILHSMLASHRFKQWVAQSFPSITPYYRIAYNLFAVFTLLPICVLMIVWRGESIIRWDGNWLLAMNGIAALVIIMFYHSTRFYDMAEFLGTRQVRLQEYGASDKAPMCLSPYHRFVRHPWYTFALILIWTREMDQLQLIASVAMTLYFVVGSHLEEQKLSIYFGEQYAAYKKKVPGLIPRPWKFLSSSDRLE